MVQASSKHICDLRCEFLCHTATWIDSARQYISWAHYERGNIMSDRPGQQPVKLAKTLTNIDALALGFGAMIGFGWVVLTGGWIQDAGTMGSVVAIVVGGGVMAAVGLVYSDLSAARRLAGVVHQYVLRGLGPRFAFIGSWALVGGYVTIVAFEAVAFPRTVAYIFPEINAIPLWDVAGHTVHLTWALIGV